MVQWWRAEFLGSTGSKIEVAGCGDGSAYKSTHCSYNEFGSLAWCSEPSNFWSQQARTWYMQKSYTQHKNVFKKSSHGRMVRVLKVMRSLSVWYSFLFCFFVCRDRVSLCSVGAYPGGTCSV